MITISLCMILKDEEEVLDRCLSSVKGLVDEIIIVDTGSTDATKQIALQYTDQVFDFAWIDDFAAARNYAFSKANKEYCMWLDADDVIEEKDRLDFLTLKNTLTLDTDIVMMRYNTAFDDDGNPSFWYYRERIIRNDQSHPWQGAVHEVITPNGNLLYSDVAICHRKLGAGDPDRNLNIYRKLLAEGRILSAREQYYYSRELYYHQLYDDAIEAFGVFLSLPDGWMEDKIEACIMSSKCYMLTGKSDEALLMLFRSLLYDIPRAEVCCEIGDCFMKTGRFETAAFWFETALDCQMDYRKGGFILPDCYDYIPAIQLCVCYDKLGEVEKAKAYNDKAGEYKPNASAFLHNKKYFDKKLKSH